MTVERFRHRDASVPALEGGKDVPPQLGSIRDFGPNQGRVQKALQKAAEHGSRNELLECLSNIRDGRGRFHHNYNVGGDGAVAASLDALEAAEKSGKLSDVLFFMKEFPELLKPQDYGRPQQLTLLEALGDAVGRNGWSREGYGMLAASFRRFCSAYRLDGLDGRLGLVYSENTYAVHDEGRVKVNMGCRSAGFSQLFEARNRIFPHEIAHYVVDRETGILDVENHPEKMLEAWGRVFRQGVSTPHLSIPAVDFVGFTDAGRPEFNSVTLYSEARELLADKVALDLGSVFVDRVGLPAGDAGAGDRGVYLEAYNRMLSPVPDKMRAEIRMLGFDDVDNNTLIQPCRYAAGLRVNASLAVDDGLSGLAEISGRLAGKFADSFVDSPMLRSYGPGLYGRLLPVFERLYRGTSYRA